MTSPPYGRPAASPTGCQTPDQTELGSPTVTAFAAGLPPMLISIRASAIAASARVGKEPLACF